MFNTLLIANRGEIACRIIKTANRLGIKSIAIYGTADQNSLHVAMASQAFCIGAPEARASYLNIDAIIAVARQSGAEAIHPGYGFLSENPEFARACLDAGIVFVGPSVSAMEMMASKQLAKQHLSNSSVPLTPGYHGTEQSDKILSQEAQKIGFPVLLKAASGGGGKGMRIVQSQMEFQAALESARREAKASFGDDIMIIEKYINDPRHIEIQLMADNFGNIVHLSERDCSIQRRHQKIIEEAPAPHLSTTLRNQLAEAAIAVAHQIDYRGAGTVEFLVEDNNNFYFMEMNTRLQVEHPVTEQILGLDLVEWQLRIAANEPLPASQLEINPQGHAIECRIYAEDPHQQLPSTGTIHFLQEPFGEGLRIDTGVQLHSEITLYYDPMIAKLIAYGSSREEAISRMHQALQHYAIGGVKTNLPILQAIIEHPQFKSGRFSTHFLNQNTLQLPSPDPLWGLLIAASADYLHLNKSSHSSLEKDAFAWQMHLKTQWTWCYLINDVSHVLTIKPINAHQLAIDTPTETFMLQAQQTGNLISVDDGKQIRRALIDLRGAQLNLYGASGVMCIERFNWKQKPLETDNSKHQLSSPMPATIIAILKQVGDKITAGEPLIVLEAMKMEHMILAPNDGILAEIFYEVGNQVSEGAELLALNAITEEHP